MKKITLVIGAGANKEIHPEVDLGSELIENISKRVTDNDTPDKNLSFMLERQGFPAALREEFQFHLDRYRTGVKNPSIDSFLYEIFAYPEFAIHRPQFLKIGKNMIISHVLGYEGDTSRKNIEKEIENPTKDKSMWLSVVGDFIDNYDMLGKDLFKVITFNYDRLLEYYLFKRFPGKDMTSFMQNNIIHVYGNVGGDQKLIPENEYLNNDPRIEVYAKDIKLIHERTGISQKIRDVIHGTDKILVMGYGLDPMNNKRLYMQEIRVGENFIFNGYPGKPYEYDGRRKIAETVRESIVDANICYFRTCKEFVAEHLNYNIVEHPK